MVAVVVLNQVVRWSLVRWSSHHPSIRPSDHPARQSKGDERGAVLVQALLILPVLILAVFGGYTVWKVASIKHSLHSGTYQATRYLCLNPVDPPVSGIWEEIVLEFVERELGNNGLAHGVSRPQAIVTFPGPEGELGCGLRFTVDTWVSLQIDIPYLSMPLTLQDRHEGWVEC